MGILWEYYGNIMGKPLEFRGNDMGILWEHYGNTMAIIRDEYGIFWGAPWESMGILYECGGNTIIA